MEKRTHYCHIASLFCSVKEFKGKWNVRIGELSAVITEGKLAQSVMLLISSCEVLGFHFCRDTDYPEVYRDFPQFLHKIPSYV
jgi:hypothetical protein